MKDNLPNYLNPHNIDPSRIEPAHIDQAPGFDSIRPGMNIGTVAVVGKGRPKLQLPTMSNAEAIEVLMHIETDIYGRIAIAKAIDALNSPWVKTSDRLPDAEQIARNDKIFLLCKQRDGAYEAYTHWADGLASHPEKFEFDYWMPVPPLLEDKE